MVRGASVADREPPTGGPGEVECAPGRIDDGGLREQARPRRPASRGAATRTDIDPAVLAVRLRDNTQLDPTVARLAWDALARRANVQREATIQAATTVVKGLYSHGMKQQISSRRR